MTETIKSAVFTSAPVVNTTAREVIFLDLLADLIALGAVGVFFFVLMPS